MPADQRVRFDHSEGASPIDQPRQRHEHDPSRIIGTPWLDLTLHIQRQLFSQEQILSGDSGMRPHRRRGEPRNITEDTQDGAGSGAKSRTAHGRRNRTRSVSPRQRSVPGGAPGLTRHRDAAGNCTRTEYLRTTP